jgi:sugar phosphate isomerase/epimerase
VRLRPGIGSFAYGWSIGVPGQPTAARPMDATRFIERAASLGAEVVQVGDNLRWTELPAPEWNRLVTLVRDRGLTLELGARGLTMEFLRDCLARCERVGVSLLRFVADHGSYQPDAATLVAVLRAAAPRLRDANVTLALENHDRFPAAALRGMVEEVASAHVGVCLDTANNLGAGEGLDTVLRELAHLTVNLHVKEFGLTRLPSQMGFTVAGRILGQGLIDLPRLLRTVVAHERCTSAILEVWTPPEPDLVATLAKEDRWVCESFGVLQRACAAVLP